MERIGTNNIIEKLKMQHTAEFKVSDIIGAVFLVFQSYWGTPWILFALSAFLNLKRCLLYFDNWSRTNRFLKKEKFKSFLANFSATVAKQSDYRITDQSVFWKKQNNVADKIKN